MTNEMINETLESGGGITWDKWHDQELIVILMSYKGSLDNVLFFHMYLMVSREKIKFSKALGTSQLIQEIVNDRNRKIVFDGELIEGAKV